MLFMVLAKKAYARNRQYRASHLLHNAVSLAFGFIYIRIWSGLGADSPLGEYGSQGMVAYIAFNQCLLWITLFVTNGLGLEQSVRTGQIALDLLRPAHLFYQAVSREWGQIAYQFLYKSLPIYILIFFLFSLPLPAHALVFVWTAVAIVFAAYLSICIQYLIGIAALWTTESRWFFWLNYAFGMLLAGFFIPLSWVPGWLRVLSFCSPYPYLLYVPTRQYMGLDGPGALLGAAGWACALTALGLLATRLARRKLEVQGG
ncbi:ABC-2 family transporter protein [Paenibacillus athensensis]|uniref:ABC transporter permease n=1 Tax=Paenibacillus athensensis TaxID=1967502 RepID=A0A4Y8PZ29_9BACL|nr:ABC-2 family transporter protein [Paenibacillus athensensis]MCD1259639.1 ABC-2 family transporter protein [Paenibacillus athensensis]